MTGTYEHSIDNAGRLIVPSKLRDKLGASFYLAVGVHFPPLRFSVYRSLQKIARTFFR